MMVGHLKPVLWIRYKYIKYTRADNKVRYFDLYMEMPNCAKEGDRRSGLPDVFFHCFTQATVAHLFLS